MRFFITLLLILSWFFSPQTGSAQTTAVEITEQQVDYVFGEKITFTATVSASAEIIEANLLLIQPGSETAIFPLVTDASSQLSATLDLRQNPLKPFTRVEYWYHLKFADNTDFQSEMFNFTYLDNRLTWQEIKNDRVHIFWTQADLSFGQQALDTAAAAIEKSQRILPVPFPDRLEIFIYPSREDLDEVFYPYNEEWIAGQASLELGVIILSIEPGPEQRLEMERQIPHEIMHILLYRLVGDKYTFLPTWLAEGISSLAEFYPNPEYKRAINNAAATNSLLPLTELCRGYPREAARAYLAYAQFDSFVRYLYTNYGSSGLQKLISSYMDGMGCIEGAQSALGVAFNELEFRWRQAILGNAAENLVWQNLLPYFALLFVIILVPLTINLRFSSRKKSSQEVEK